MMTYIEKNDTKQHTTSSKLVITHHKSQNACLLIFGLFFFFLNYYILYYIILYVIILFGLVLDWNWIVLDVFCMCRFDFYNAIGDFGTSHIRIRLLRYVWATCCWTTIETGATFLFSLFLCFRFLADWKLIDKVVHVEKCSCTVVHT